MQDKKALRMVKKECREMAREMMRQQYGLYDAIWYDRIRIDSALLVHGREVVAEINQRMPNLLSRNPNACSLDIIARRYGFECDSDLVDFLLAYTPRGPVEERFFNQLMDGYLGEGWDAAEHASPETAIDTVPF